MEECSGSVQATDNRRGKLKGMTHKGQPREQEGCVKNKGDKGDAGVGGWGEGGREK